MKVSDCGRCLASALASSENAIPGGSPLAAIAASITGMAEAYNSDGGVFLSRGDEVNALASCFYAFGWLHFGQASGLLECRDKPFCPFSLRVDPLEPAQAPALEEKTLRYQRLLTTARASVVPAPEPGTETFALSGRVALIADTYLMAGGRYLASGKEEDALASFSYAHGWLDAAVVFGLFRITANREIFTV
jgi:hypothetical protein